jgi:hypothetical protein
MAVSIAHDLDVLERSLVSLKVDYERFFSGELKVPPVPARKRVEQILRRVGNVVVEKAAEQFRLQALQGRFTALSELWEKRLIVRETGRGLLRPSALGRPAGQPAPPARADAGTPGSVKGFGRGDIRSLFERYCAARAATGEDVSRLRFDRFEELVKKQAAEIRSATGASRLAFDVQVRDGKVRLVGRALPTPTKGTP